MQTNPTMFFLALLLSGAVLAAPLAMAGGDHGAIVEEVAHVDGEVDPGLRSPDLDPGQSWSHTFTELGKMDYHCHPHPWMLGSITIAPSSGRAPINHTIRIVEPEGQDFEKWTWSPAITTIEVGDTVTWVNEGTVIHVFQETTAEHAEHIGTAQGAEDDHAAVAGVADAGHSSGGFLSQGWLWIGAALIGGVYIGRKTVGMGPASSKPALPLPATPTALGNPAPSPQPPAAPAVEPNIAPNGPSPAPSMTPDSTGLTPPAEPDLPNATGERPPQP